MKVFVVDDDPAVRASLERSLAFEGYAVVTAADGEAALRAVEEHRPDAVLLDLGLPRLGGVEVCRRMRAAGDRTPVLMLTARDATSDRVAGLDSGADDYLPKPFALEELLARLRALLRRAGATAEGGEVLAVGDLRLDTATREVTRAGRPIVLTRTEHELLELFLRNPRRVLERPRILDDVWGFDFDPASNTLEVYVGYLRRKTEEGGLLTVLAGQEADRPRADVRLDAVVAAAVERARRRAAGRPIAVELAPWVVPDAEATALERAVLNLLDNALKFSPPEGRVAVRLDGGVLTVDDEGPGVPPAEREAAFERFWRSEAARGLPGSVLGLSIVAETAAAHGGSAALSASPAGGTRATLTLPGSSIRG